ncbi:dihydroorotate dehydrogenase B (NAD(+)), electron transfer subunit [Sporolactobacillus putidus]|uniref:Dihydroorotate dehydrogenase B (NAD(+)), electron transfer subunit n=1 Tax=Sporolactobacillus putidus TaxID=492735 RepID=A0A917RXH6_9BACL|nr:dihydroorotate dehydrogenase B (NAD(+)), electron transfer subunit [Sporolactobacillus putidus]
MTALEESVRPGQFFHIQCSDDWRNLLRRPFSVYKFDRRTRILEFLYLIKGSGTQALMKKRPGEMLDMIGPLGKPFSLPAGDASILLAARGVGVATLHALAQAVPAEGRRAIAIVSAQKRDDLLAVDDLRQSGAQVYAVTDEDGTSTMDQVGKLAEMLIEDYGISAVYTCGSKRLAKLMQNLATIHNLYAEIAMEAHMACGLGDCYACACPIRKEKGIEAVRICSEGPVFPLRQAVLS